MHIAICIGLGWPCHERDMMSFSAGDSGLPLKHIERIKQRLLIRKKVYVSGVLAL